MSKKMQLSIPKPCHENWDAMTPVQQGKFCGSCQKQVVDFSTMSDRQVAAFFKKPSTGSVCGRFMTDQLEREIEIPKKRIPWFKYFFQLALPAFLLSIKASAQKTKGKVSVQTQLTDTTKPVMRPTMGMVAPVCRPDIKGDIVIEKPAKLNGILQLKIVDEKGQAISYASIETGVMGKGGAADKNGFFNLDKSILNVNGKIFVSAGGYERKAIEVKLFSHLTGSYQVVLKNKGWMENAVITALPVQPRREMMGAVSFVSADQLYLTIKGKVVDENNNPVSFATVQIKGIPQGVSTDEKGVFIIRPSFAAENITLVASAITFLPGEATINKTSWKDMAIIRLGKDNRTILGELYIKTPEKKQSKTIPLIPANNNNAASAFKVFPNPVDAGTNLSIEWLQKEEGYYTLQVLSESGQSVYQQEIWIDTEARSLSIHTPEVAAGNYFVVFTNKKTNEKFSEKIVIQ